MPLLKYTCCLKMYPLNLQPTIKRMAFLIYPSLVGIELHVTSTDIFYARVVPRRRNPV